MINDRPNLQDSLEIGLPGCGPLGMAFSDTIRPLRQQIFELVRSTGAIPRVELAKQLRISPASVTTITSALIEGGLLEEVPTPPDLDSGRGRPAVALGVRGSAHHVVGLNISDREYTAVVMDFSGNSVASETISSHPGPTELSLILETVETLVDRVCNQSGIEKHALSAIGVGLPGFVDAPSGIVHWSPIFLNRDVMLARAVSELLGIPVHVDNDANMVTLAEQWFGVGRTLSDFAVVTIEQGLGMGLVINGSLYRGALGIGMELGHTKVHLDGALFDGDGLLDLVVVNRRSPLELYQNVTPQSGHWAEVELTMDGANRNAVGAWVEVRANGTTQVQENTIGGGHAGGLAIALHFGLGDATAGDIRVTWPDGTISAWQPLHVDQVNHIEKPHP